MQTTQTLVTPCRFHAVLLYRPAPSRLPPLQCTFRRSHCHSTTLSPGSSLHPMHSMAPLCTSLFPYKLTAPLFPSTAFPDVPSPWVIRPRLPSQRQTSEHHRSSPLWMTLPALTACGTTRHQIGMGSHPWLSVIGRYLSCIGGRCTRVQGRKTSIGWKVNGGEPRANGSSGG